MNSDQKSLLKGIYQPTPIGEVFFSQENINRIQKMIKHQVFVRTNGKYKLEVEQNETDLLVVMRDIYITCGKNLPYKVIHQVKELNHRTIMNSDGYPEMIAWISRGDPGLLKNATNLGWKISEEYRGQGIMTNLLNLFLEENTPDIDGFAAKIMKTNIPSIKLALKCGFKIYQEDLDYFYVQKL